MGSCCASGNNGGNGWVYVDASGGRTKYATEVEALAAKVRAGGVGEVKPG